MTGLPLTSLTVVDLSSGVSGNFCAKLLADYGADVVTIEPPGGDPLRGRAPFLTAEDSLEAGALHLYLNTNKRSVVLDLATHDGRRTLRGLLAKANALVCDAAPGYMDGLGLGDEARAAELPSLVTTLITPYGQTGPNAHAPATNLTSFASGGQMAVTGEPDREPLRNGGEQAEYQAGLNGFTATLAGIWAAAESGIGDTIDISAQEVQASTLEIPLNVFCYLGHADMAHRRGNIASATLGIYPGADGYIGVHAMPRNFAPLARLMETEWMLEDETFATYAARLAHDDELRALVYAWASTQDTHDVYRRAGEGHAPVAFVHGMADVLASPQLRHRGFFHAVAHPVAGELEYAGPPVRMGEGAWRPGRAPLLGEHADEVIASLPATAPTGGTAPTVSRTSLPRPLEGIRILDLTAVWAGPYATRLLADMGAEVIKVEGPHSPDLLRALHMLPAGTELDYNKSAYFNHNNRNKKGIALDLASARGRELALRLTAICDVVIENFRAEVLDNLGLGYDVLKQARDDIILVSMPGHGKTGPEKDFVAFGTNIEQVSGLASISGYADGPPQKTGISYGDPVAGAAAAAAVVMALIARRETGRGRYVEVAQRESLSCLIGEHLLAYQRSGDEPPRLGNRHLAYAPHGAYPAAGDDSWVTIACRDDHDFATLCRVMGREDLATDQRFAGARARHANQDILDAEISAWTGAQDRDRIFNALAAAGVPASPVNAVSDLYADPHLRARGFFERVTHAQAGSWEMDRPLYRFANRPTYIERNGPMFGEHNREVFQGLLGLSDADFAGLLADGVTASDPDMSAHR